MSNIITISGIHGYVDKNGVAQLNAEDVARGWGFTQVAKSGNVVVRWERMNKYLNEFGFIPTSGDGIGTNDFIPENMVYRLGFKASNEVAQKFQALLADEVLPALRKAGSYALPKSKQHGERLASVNNAVKILMPILKQAGCDSKIQLLTAKSLYEKSGVVLPIEIKADKKYYDTKYIARQCGIFTKSNKPAYQAVAMIIKKLDIREGQYTDTWETNGSWQGAVRKFDESVIAAVKDWLVENNNPEYIDYAQCDGQAKRYHVFYKLLGKEVVA